MEKPALKIIDNDLWESVRARITNKKQPFFAKRAATLFGGLMKCPYCNSSIIAVNQKQFGCASRKDRGETVCKGILFPRKKAEENLLKILKSDLQNETVIKEIEEKVRAQLQNKPDESEKIKKLDAEITRLVNAIANIGYSEALKNRLKAAK